MLTKYGLPQAAVYPGIIAAVMTASAVVLRFQPWILSFEIPLFCVFIWSLSFFRDPKRRIDYNDNILYSPCDGTVTEISEDEGLRISMFLSLFNVHINRAPCDGIVERITYKKGEYRDARDPLSATVNESNEICLTRSNGPVQSVIIRQVSGAVARHIVCAAQVGDKLTQGQKFGMIKFGSRTEVILPDTCAYKICVKKGDKVKAGITPLVAYNSAENR